MGSQANSINAVAFSPDGKTLAEGTGKSGIWLTGQAVSTLAHASHTGTAHAVAFSPAGKATLTQAYREAAPISPFMLRQASYPAVLDIGQAPYGAPGQISPVLYRAMRALGDRCRSNRPVRLDQGDHVGPCQPLAVLDRQVLAAAWLSTPVDPGESQLLSGDVDGTHA